MTENFDEITPAQWDEVKNANDTNYIASILLDANQFKQYINVPSSLWNNDATQVLWEIICNKVKSEDRIPSIDEIKNFITLHTACDKNELLRVSLLQKIDRIFNLIDRPEELKQFQIDFPHIVNAFKIKNSLNQAIDYFRDGNIKELKKVLNFDNVIQKKETILTEYTPSQWMEQYGDIEKQIEETSIYNKGFVCRGEMIEIVASYGCGKSVFANQLAFFGANGLNCCGWDTGGKKLRTLIIQPEDRGVKQTRIFQSQLKRNNDNGNIKVLCWMTIDKVSLDREMAQFKPDVIIINPLYRYAESNKRLQDPEAFTPILTTIQDLIVKHNCCAIVIHHLRKDGTDEFGPAILKWFFRKVIYIDKFRSKPGFYTFRVDKGENESGDIHNTIIKHSDEHNDLFWEVSDFEESKDESITSRKYTIKILDTLDCPLKLMDIVKKTGIDKGNIYRELNRLLQLKHIEKDEQGYYKRYYKSGCNTIATETLNN